METSELFRKILKEYLSMSGHGAQAQLADELGMDRRHLNAFLNGRRMLSESKREEIAEKLGYSYLDFLLFDRENFSKRFFKPENEQIKTTLAQAIIIFEESLITMLGEEAPLRLPYKIKAETIIKIYNRIAKQMAYDSIINAIDIDKLIYTLEYADKRWTDALLKDELEEFCCYDSTIEVKANNSSFFYSTLINNNLENDDNEYFKHQRLKRAA